MDHKYRKSVCVRVHSTEYGSFCHLQFININFHRFESCIERHIASYAIAVSLARFFQ